MDRVDFRSDTVTWPTPEMREAMAKARVGDDVYGEDPTVNELEALSAAMAGKEAGLFVASGTMGNLVAILAHADRGDEAIVGFDSHVMRGEAGGMATLGGIVPHALPTDRFGRVDLGQLAAAIAPDDPHFPRTRLIVLENSYAAKNGFPVPLEYFADVRAIAERHQLVVHLDGARLFNAAIALGVEPAAITQYVDSVSFCLSKGLCAPVGSVLCGTTEFIRRARRIRKVLGGGMRQAGVLAAAGLVSLNKMVERLAEDHAHAQLLAEGLSEVPGVAMEPSPIRTNIVFFRLTDETLLSADELARRLREEENLWLGVEGPRLLRAVTHYWVGPDEVSHLVQAICRILRT